VADYAKLSDDELLAATRGDPEAFGALYERHARGVLAYLARATGDRELALDLTAEVFAAALVASDRYRTGEAPAGSWLFGIARNKLAETRRRNARADAARRKLGIPALSFTDQALDRVDEVLDAERVGYLESLGELTPDEREAVTARVIDERDYADVARAAGVSQAAMRQRVSRGLARLAEMRNRAT
jgi:RNA polymerase sigma factor (sigma-70 family)